MSDQIVWCSSFVHSSRLWGKMESIYHWWKKNFAAKFHSCKILPLNFIHVKSMTIAEVERKISSLFPPIFTFIFVFFSDPIMAPCSRKSNGFYRLKGRCDSFLWCVMGRAYIQRCPPGTLFNSRRKFCDFPSLNMEC